MCNVPNAETSNCRSEVAKWQTINPALHCTVHIVPYKVELLASQEIPCYALPC